MNTINFQKDFLKPVVMATIMLSFLIFIPGWSTGANISRISKISIERNKPTAGHNEKRVAEQVDTLLLTQASIDNQDVLVFDIPGLGAFLKATNGSLNSVHLLLGEIELSEFMAYYEDSNSDQIRFQYSKSELTPEHRIKLYQLPGRYIKESRIGIRIDQTEVLFYNYPATIYLKEFEHRGIFCWLTIGLFVVFFLTLIFRFDSVIKDSWNLDPTGSKPNTYFSFSKSQFAFWTFIILISFIYIWILSGNLSSINTTALVLLGITSATITTTNLIQKSEENQASGADQQDQLRKTRIKPENEKSGFIEDVLSDANGISIHRLQAFVFNLIFGIAFLQSVLINYAMPEFSETQLILLGLSNGTYAFLKRNENK